jgi:hypothetical protein
MDEQATIDVVASARDVDDSSFYIDSHTDASYGTVTVVDNKIVYTRTSTPEDGSDSFTVTIRDKENTDPAFHLTTAPEGYRTANVTVNIGLYSGYPYGPIIRRMNGRGRGSLYIQSGLRVV